MTSVTGWIDNSTIPKSKGKQRFHLQLRSVLPFLHAMQSDHNGASNRPKMQATVGSIALLQKGQLESDVEPEVAARDVAQRAWL